MTDKTKIWLSGLEKAVGGAIASAVLQSFTEGGWPHDKAGWLKFASICAGSGYVAVRLYLTQSPCPVCAPGLPAGSEDKAKT